MHTLRSAYGGGMLRIIWFLMAVHFLNFSIDSRDANPNSVPEDLTINDIESISEFLAEVVIGIDNAFAEQDEHDSDDGGGSLDFFKVFLAKHEPGLWSATLLYSGAPIKYHIFNPLQVPSLSYDIIAPPPRA